MSQLMVDDPKHAALVIFLRRPAFGYGKQRIAAELGKPAAWHIARLLLDAALEDARGWPGPVVLSPAAAADVEWAGPLLPQAKVVPQPDGNLGQRLNYVDTSVRAQGIRHVIFVGTDAPGMTPDHLTAARAALAEYSAVFIPATDGGVTLLGANKSWPSLGDLPWETDRLHKALRKRCETVGWKCLDLEAGYDIDTRSDLLLAGQRLESDERPARTALRDWIVAAELERSDDAGAALPPGSISVIVPVFRDLDALTRLVNALDSLAERVDEVVVIDGGNDPAIRAFCSQARIRYARTARNRGAQLQLGATLARGEILWFLHADAEPARDAVGVIRTQIRRGCSGGYFRFRFSGVPRWYKSALAALINLRARFGTPYGDQGLFVRQEDYCAAGGFAPVPLFEEVALIRELRRRGRFMPVRASIGVATRRWERDGWLRRSLRNRMLALRYMLGAKPETLARAYPAERETAESG